MIDGNYDDEDYGEPVGSCDICGVNLYEYDDAELCDGCLYMATLYRETHANEEGR